MSYTYEYPRPALTVDCVVFGFDGTERELKVLLIQRKTKPYKDYWALPGGFMNMKENLEEAAMRELEEETGLSNIFLEQLFSFGQPERDPRGRVVSVAYFALVKHSNYQELHAATDAADAKWFPVKKVPLLAFDHDNICERLFSEE